MLNHSMILDRCDAYPLAFIFLSKFCPYLRFVSLQNFHNYFNLKIMLPDLLRIRVNICRHILIFLSFARK